jgi:hypothetical protein
MSQHDRIKPKECDVKNGCLLVKIVDAEKKISLYVSSENKYLKFDGIHHFHKTKSL